MNKKKESSAISIFGVIMAILMIYELFTFTSSIIEENQYEITKKHNERIEVANVVRRKRYHLGNLKDMRAYNFLYKEYNLIKSLNIETKTDNGLLYTALDTTVRLNAYSKFTVIENSYFRKGKFNGFSFGFKTNNNINVFFHKRYLKFNLLACFKKLKKEFNIEILEPTVYPDEDNIYNVITYKFIHLGNKFNGITYSFESDPKSLFIQFESNKLKKEELEKWAANYMTERYVFF